MARRRVGPGRIPSACQVRPWRLDSLERLAVRRSMFAASLGATQTASFSAPVGTESGQSGVAKALPQACPLAAGDLGCGACPAVTAAAHALNGWAGRWPVVRSTGFGGALEPLDACWPPPRRLVVVNSGGRGAKVGRCTIEAIGTTLRRVCRAAEWCSHRCGRWWGHQPIQSRRCRLTCSSFTAHKSVSKAHGVDRSVLLCRPDLDPRLLHAAPLLAGGRRASKRAER